MRESNYIVDVIHMNTVPSQVFTTILPATAVLTLVALAIEDGIADDATLDALAGHFKIVDEDTTIIYSLLAESA